MGSTAMADWRIKGEEFDTCNCAWGCPCQFNALPTQGRCEAFVGFQISEGHFDGIRLDGVKFAWIVWWPGAVHEGNGVRLLIIDEAATLEQQGAIRTLDGGAHGGAFAIIAAVCPTVHEPVLAPITIQIDRERRQALLQIPNVGEAYAEPIKNPVTGEDHRARIVLPDGFEYKEAEMANATTLRVSSQPPLAFSHTNTYAQLNAIDWGSN